MLVVIVYPGIFLKISSPLYHRETFLHFGRAELNSVAKNLMAASMDNILLKVLSVSSESFQSRLGGTESCMTVLMFRVFKM